MNNWFARNRTTRIREILEEAEQWLQSHNVDVLYGDFNGCADSVGGAQPAVVEMLPPERWHRPPAGLLLFGQARQWAAEGTCVTGFALSASSTLLLTEHGQWDIQPEQLSLGKADTGWHLPSYMRLRPAEVSSGRRMRSEAGADKRKARKRKQQQDRCRLEPNPKWRSRARTDQAPEQVAYGGGAGSSDPWTDWHTAEEHTTPQQQPPPQQAPPTEADQTEAGAAGAAATTGWHESTWTAPERWASPERWWSRSEWAEWKQHRADTQSKQWQWHKDCHHAQLMSFVELVTSGDCMEAGGGKQALLTISSTACSSLHRCTPCPMYASTRPAPPPPSQSRTPADIIPLQDLPNQEAKANHTQQHNLTTSGSWMLSTRLALGSSMQCSPRLDMEHDVTLSKLEATLMHLLYLSPGSRSASRRATLSSLKAEHRACSTDSNGTKESSSRVEMPALRQSKHASIYALSNLSLRTTGTRDGTAPYPRTRKGCRPCAARRSGSARSPISSRGSCCCRTRRCEACPCGLRSGPAPSTSPAGACATSMTLASWSRRSDYRCLYDTYSHSRQPRSTTATSTKETTRCCPSTTTRTTTTNRGGRGGGGGARTGHGRGGRTGPREHAGRARRRRLQGEVHEAEEPQLHHADAGGAPPLEGVQEISSSSESSLETEESEDARPRTPPLPRDGRASQVRGPLPPGLLTATQQLRQYPRNLTHPDAIVEVQRDGEITRERETWDGTPATTAPSQRTRTR